MRSILSALIVYMLAIMAPQCFAQDDSFNIHNDSLNLTVLHVSIDNFYVSYQLNAYTKETNKQPAIYSVLHQNIKDISNQRGIEILSPHHRGQRDGNRSTILAAYLPDDFKAPSFNVNVEKRPDN
ncbi:MAG: hypothetical protein ISR55_13565 [Bacteroidetes bacterium]|nr:hypothetical protein [Bacteroidota bacterium]MBL6964845.1 hypothetical protein [Bacteroidota bacterium]